MTTTEFAATLNTTPALLRKFLRSQAAGVGKGRRYTIDRRSTKRLTREFAAWAATQA